MSETKKNVLAFIDTSIDELAKAEMPFFKQVRAIFKVFSAGKKILNGLKPDDFFENFKTILKHELKQIANSSHTDLGHMKLVMERINEIMKDESFSLNNFADEKTLENELRKKEGIPRESRLPNEIAAIIKDNIEKIFTAQQWCAVIYDNLNKLEIENGEAHDRIERFVKKAVWCSEKNNKTLEELKELFEYKDSFCEYLDNKSLPKKFINEGNRFHYLNENIKLRGRESEIKQIESFLYSPDIISIWAISGHGGVGKSKLARNICDCNSWCFKPVWLEEDFRSISLIKSGYEYTQPLLFVCDYADEKKQDIIDLIKKMHNSEVWSRFLLIAREGTWFDGLRENATIIEHWYSPNIDPPDLSVNPLSDEDFKLIIEDFRYTYYRDKVLTDNDISFILYKTSEISPPITHNMRKSRCLFMLLVTDAVLSGKPEEWINYDYLHKLYFSRNKEHIDDDSVDAGYRLLALATALKGLNVSDKNLPEFIRTDIELINRNFRNKEDKDAFWNKISDGIYIKNKSTILPFEPDILGEHLFLWQFLDRIDEYQQNEWLDFLCERIDAEDKAVELFIQRCASDWKEKGLEFIHKFNQRMTEVDE